VYPIVVIVNHFELKVQKNKDIINWIIISLCIRNGKEWNLFIMSTRKKLKQSKIVNRIKK